MASAWSQLDQLLTCAICLDRYRNPKLLPCQHTFCMEPCLDGLIDYARRQIKCPECRAEHRIPYQGIQQFPTNVTLMRFLELHRDITGEEPEPPPSMMERCSVCSEKSSVERCAHCEKKICPDCKEAHVDILRREINRINNQVRRGLHRLSEALTQTKKNAEKLQFNCNQVKEEIEDIVRRYSKDLRTTEDKLKRDLEMYTQSEMKSINKLKEDLEVEVSNIASNCDLVDNYIRDDFEWSDVELLEYKNIFLKMLDFLRTFDPDNGDFARRIKFQPRADPDVLHRNIADFGELKINAPMNPPQSLVGAPAQSNALMRSQSDHRLAAQFARRDNRSFTDANQRLESERPTSPLLGRNRRGDADLGYRRFSSRGDYDHHDRPTSRYSSDSSRWREGEDYGHRGGRYHSRDYDEDNSESHHTSGGGRTVRFADEPQQQTTRVVFDVDDATKGPLSGVVRLADSPKIMERLHQNEVRQKQNSQQAIDKEAVVTPTVLPTTPPAQSPPTPTPRRQTSRQQSEDEIDRQKRANQQQASSTSTPPEEDTTPAAVVESEPEIDPNRSRRRPSLTEQPSSRQVSDPDTPKEGSPDEPNKRKPLAYSRHRSDTRFDRPEFKPVSPTSRFSLVEEPNRFTRLTEGSSRIRSPRLLSTRSILEPPSNEDSCSSDTNSFVSCSSSLEAIDDALSTASSGLPRSSLVKTPSLDRETATERPQDRRRPASPPVPAQPEEESQESEDEDDEDEAEDDFEEVAEEPPKPVQSSFFSRQRRLPDPEPRLLEMHQNDSDEDEESDEEEEDEEEEEESPVATPSARPEASKESSSSESEEDDDDDEESESDDEPTKNGEGRLKQASDEDEDDEDEPPTKGLTNGKRSSDTDSSASSDQNTTTNTTNNINSLSSPAAKESSAPSRFRKRPFLARSKSSHEIGLGYEEEEDEEERPPSPTVPTTPSYRSRRTEDSVSNGIRTRSSIPTSPPASTTSNRCWSEYLRNKYGGGVSSLGLNMPRSRSSASLWRGDSEASSEEEAPLSPFSSPRSNYLQKRRMLFEIGGRGSEAGRFSWPRGVAVGPDGSIVVADSSNHRVQTFDARGQFSFEFGCYGSGEGQFDSPPGVAVNRIGQFIVSDRYNHRVQLFDPSGRFLRTFGCEGRTDGRFSSPWGIATDSLGFIYVCDKGNHRIQVFQSDGTFVGKFGGQGSRPGQLEQPHSVAVTPTNRVVVSDAHNHRVQLFDVNGRALTAFGGEGDGPGQFRFPRGVAVDDQGFIAVADSGNHRVQVFGPDGALITNFGGWGSGAGEFQGLEGVAVTAGGCIVACDRENHRVQVF